MCRLSASHTTTCVFSLLYGNQHYYKQNDNLWSFHMLFSSTLTAVTQAVILLWGLSGDTNLISSNFWKLEQTIFSIIPIIILLSPHAWPSITAWQKILLPGDSVPPNGETTSNSALFWIIFLHPTLISQMGNIISGGQIFLMGHRQPSRHAGFKGMDTIGNYSK